MTDLVLVLVYAAVIGGLLAVLRGAIEVVPLSRGRRQAATRAMPVLAAAGVLALAVLVVRTLLSDQPRMAAAGTMLVIGAFTVASWSALRDVASGVFLKAGQVCREGDLVRIDDLSGRVIAMGLRVMVVETSDGDEAIIPFSQVSRERLMRSPAADGLAPHVFRLRPDEGVDLAAVKAAVRRSALLSHWAAVSREPEVTRVGAEVEVTVFSLDPDHGPDVEATVRRSCGDLLEGAAAEG